VLDYSAIAVCGTRRVNIVDAPCFDCPDVAPPGKHLYTVGAAALDALAPGDIDAEFKQVLDGLRDIIPGFDSRCRVITRTCYRGKWPGFRTVPARPFRAARRSRACSAWATRSGHAAPTTHWRDKRSISAKKLRRPLVSPSAFHVGASLTTRSLNASS